MNGRLSVYTRLLGYLKPYSKEVALAYISMLTATALALIIPQIIKAAIDYGLESGSARLMFAAGGLILLIALVRAVVGFGQRFYGNWLTHRAAYDLRNDFYQRVQHLPFSFHDRAQTGDLMSRATSDITESERFVGIGLMDLTATIILLVGVTVAVFFEDAILGMLVLVPLIILVYTALRFGNMIRPKFKEIQKQMGVLSASMQESMTGIGVVKAFAKESYELEKFDVQNEAWFEQRYAAIKIWANYWPLFNLLLAVSIFLLLLVGGAQALAGTISVGTVFALIAYVMMLNGPVLRLGFLVNMAATASASASRVFEIIDTPNEVEDAPDAVDMPIIDGEVRFESVDFAYRTGPTVLHDISFTARPDQIVALIGPTGSGKSSITGLIPRFYDPTAGRVWIDGVDIRGARVESLRHQIGIVLQEPFLFRATIAENIAYGRPDAPRDEIVAAAKAASAHKFIESFPDGYDTNVGERGVTLSGGQKQRIAIARALLCDPRILILDDSTSSVDTETEHLIQQALTVLMEGRTTFIIAQRLLTLKSADQILVLDHGKIVERGLHDELLAADGLYREIYDLQLRDQEEFTTLVESEQEPTELTTEKVR